MLRQTTKKCCTCPGISLTCLLSIPVGSVFLFWFLVQLICDAKSFTSYFDEKRIASFDGLSNDVNDLWIYLMVVPTYFICVFLIVETCIWCNATHVRGERDPESNRDPCRFIFIAVTLVSKNIILVFLHFSIFYSLKFDAIPVEDFEDQFKFDEDFRPYSDTVQYFHKCCGLHDYTDWGADIPFSCCEVSVMKPDCQKNLSNVHPKGCLSVILTYVNNEVKPQVFNVKVRIVLVGTALLVLILIVMHFARRYYFEDFTLFEANGTNDGLNDSREALSCNTDPANGISENNEGSSSIPINNISGYITLSSIEQYC